ncbi:hypothetical protein [Mycolicibacterium celeriflavum]|uniref:Uncharacterized protein n=1 Tax=Mycolicibacterium celeriflavum TaxID=1249101 RepID=A0A1X0BTP5_MYCCF|nr:hypothetical protein [Mycolicibacterium celeriflavum]MCV7239893.1 hypothetical protein [Mycolicibacterium celeriflavum]ORA47223.1 hypothetical protein BST21_13280 [Mycolicibacterium celeriflavum]BBY44261.1 hypothetical protein MCEL_25560 [Mycolicibacterium celeriflavum]
MKHPAPLFALTAAGLLLAPMAHADTGDLASAEEAVYAVYEQVQAACTPSSPPQPRSITWETFYPGASGNGVVNDANEGLGGPFAIYYTNPRVGPANDDPSVGRAYGQWNVDLQFC